MSSQQLKIKLIDMVLCFSRALDLLHPAISDHHLRVAYIAACLAEELDLPRAEIRDVVIAGALHDVGAASSPALTPLLNHALAEYQFGDMEDTGNLHRHGFEGFILTHDFPPFARAAAAIRFHHVNWDFGRGADFFGEAVPLASHVLHLADRVAVLPNNGRNILEQAGDIRATIAADSGKQFKPEIVAAFEAISARESFWLDVLYPHKEPIIRGSLGEWEVGLGLPALEQLGIVFGKIIDYRSAYTATHSSGVAATAEALALRIGLPFKERKLLRVAGYLHDIGKLAIAPEIIEKQGKLTSDEMLLVRQHPYYTYRILSMVPGLETVTTWASLHHERLDGNGYPFRPKEIPLGARIIAIADIFTAITENRPYRQGMNRKQALDILHRLVIERAIDGDIVAALEKDFDELHVIRSQSQQASASRAMSPYSSFMPAG